MKSQIDNNFPLELGKFYPFTSRIFILIPDSICWFPLWKVLASSLYLRGSCISRWCVCYDLIIHSARNSVYPFNLEACDPQFWGKCCMMSLIISSFLICFWKCWTSYFETLSFLFFPIFYFLTFLFYFLEFFPLYFNLLKLYLGYRILNSQEISLAF